MKRVMSIGISWAQARRISCEHCGRAYTFVHGGTERAEAEQSVGFSDEAELRRTAFREAANAVDACAEAQQRGRGRCPHCHDLQEWMRVSPALAIGGLFVATLALAGVAGFVLNAVVGQSVALIGGVGVVGVGVVVSVVAGLRLADPPGPQPHKSDPLAKTDEQLRTLLEESAELHQDPFLRWWKAAEEPVVFNKKNLIECSMGLWDQTGQPLAIPAELTAAARSAALNRMDA